MKSANGFFRIGAMFLWATIGLGLPKLHAEPAANHASLVQGHFPSQADRLSFENAMASTFGGEIKIENPDNELVNGDGAPDDLMGSSVSVDGNTALFAAHGDTVGSNPAQGSVYVFVRDGISWNLQTKLVAEDGAANDFFGRAVALTGDTALVGATGVDASVNGGDGAAYVFVRVGDSWTQQAKLTVSDNQSNNAFFGSAVALSDDTALVSAQGGGDGSVYAFSRSNGTWTRQAKLIAVDTLQGDNFGGSIAVSGDTALIGSPFDDIDGRLDQGSSYVFTRSGSIWSQQTKLTTVDGGQGDNFGTSVALVGDTALVGAWGDDIDLKTDQGSAYVFTRNGNIWSQQSKLTASDGATDDRFGYVVALSANNALVSAVEDDFNRGSAYTFANSNGLWSQQTKLFANDRVRQVGFGYALALSGDSAIIGALFSKVGVNLKQGAVYAYTQSNNGWGAPLKLTSGASATGEAFGASVAIDGDTALVGAAFDDLGDKENVGSVYVFVRSENGWRKQAKLGASDAIPRAAFGASVALSGDTALIGAPGDGDMGSSERGSAYVFVRLGDTWNLQMKLRATDGVAGDFFASSVALVGNTAVVGAQLDDVNANANQGSAYVFLRTGSVWSQQAKLTARDGGFQDYFGNSVALSRDTVLVGAYADSSGANANQGSAYVFVRTDGLWSQQAKLTAGGGQSSYLFGCSVALSGNTALVGAKGDDVATSNTSGSAYVFVGRGNVWEQQTRLIAADAMNDDSFGFSVALSGDTALIGAQRDDYGVNIDQGSAYVFKRRDGLWRTQAKLTASDGSREDFYGQAVALSGDTMMVGVSGDDSTGVFGNSDVGAVYLYVNDGVFSDSFED